MYIDSFSGDVSSLKRGHRNEENVLAVLKDDPYVSTWDMSEFTWLRNAIENLERRGFIRAEPVPYPWHKYTITGAGNEMLQMLRENAIRRIDGEIKKPTVREIERNRFENDANQYGFDMTRHECAAPEPWSEYASEATGHRWAGWLAANGI